MKKVLILILSLFVIFCSTQKDTPNPKRGIKIETVSRYGFEGAKFGEYISVYLGKEICKYDSNGNRIEVSISNSDGYSGSFGQSFRKVSDTSIAPVQVELV